MITKTGHEIGRTYRSLYWQQTYTVLSAAPDDVFGEVVTVLWADGTTTTHATRRGNDPMVSTDRFDGFGHAWMRA